MPFRAEKFGSKYLSVFAPKSTEVRWHNTSEPGQPNPPDIDAAPANIDSNSLEQNNVPAGEMEVISSAEFNRRLKQSGKIAHVSVLDLVLKELEIDEIQGDDKHCIKIENCVFYKGLTLLDRLKSFPIEFKECTFYNFVSAADTTQNNSLTFTDCRFEQYTKISFENARMGSNLQFTRCNIIGFMNFESLHVGGNLGIEGCTITGKLYQPFDSPTALLDSKTLIVKSGDKIEIKFDNTLISIDQSGTVLYMSDATINGSLSIRFDYINGVKNKACVMAGDIYAERITVKGDAYFYGLIVIGNVEFSNSKFEKDVFLHNNLDAGIQFRACGYLSFQCCHMLGTLTLAYSFIEGVVNLYRISIGVHIGMFGLKTGGDINLTFANVNGMLSAYRNSATTVKIPVTDNNGKAKGSQFIITDSHYKVLDVSGNIEMRDANINIVRLQAISAKDIIADGGNFESFAITLGIGPGKENGKLKVEYSTVQSIQMTSVTVTESINLCGIQCQQASKDLKDITSANEPNNASCIITSSTIGKHLQFFEEKVLKTLYSEFSACLDSTKINDKATAEEVIDMGIPFYRGKGVLRYPSQFVGDINLSGNKINGILDLRNIQVTQKIDLAGTSVSMETNIGTCKMLNDASNTKAETTCLRINMDKLKTDGDLILTGLKVGKQVVYSAESENNDKEGGVIAQNMEIRGAIRLVDRKRLISPYDPNKKKIAVQHTKQHKADQCFIGGRLDLTGTHAGLLSLNADNFAFSTTEIQIGKNDFQPRIFFQRAVFGQLEIETPTPWIDLRGIDVKEWVLGDNTPHIDHYAEILEKMSPFEKSTYADIEKALRNEAKDTDANTIYRNMRERAFKEMNFRNKLLDSVPRYSIGYGTKLWIPFVLWAMLFILTIALFMYFIYPTWGGIIDTRTHIWLVFKNAFYMAYHCCVPFAEFLHKEEKFPLRTFSMDIIMLLSKVLLSVGLLGITAKLIRDK